MSWIIRAFNLILISLVLGFSVKNVSASSFLGSSDYYRKCEKKFFEWTTTEKEEEDDSMLIKAKIAYWKKRYENAVKYADQTISQHSEEARAMQNSLDDTLGSQKKKYLNINH